jgi:TetR/AcrR family transcriptional regulator, cholesterol catabolism regulator
MTSDATMASATIAPRKTKEQLIRAAVRLFSEQGYAQTSLQQLVQTAGLTKGAFYYYFSSKEEILTLIYDSYLDDQLSRIEDVVGLGLAPSETMRGVIRAMLGTVELYPDRITIFLRERAALSEHGLRAMRAKREQYQQVVIEVIERGVTEGAFAPTGDTRLTAYAIIGMCAWANEWYRPNGAQSMDEIARLYGDLVLDGLHHGRLPALAGHPRDLESAGGSA